MISKTGYKIWCEELMGNGLGEYREFTLNESLHGDLPVGIMKFLYSDKSGIVEDIKNITINLHSSNTGEPFKIKMKGHVYNITSDNMYVYYHIMICDRDFITKNRMRILGNEMEGAVRTLFSGNISCEVKSNVNSHVFQQKNMTDYNYLKEILPSYNKDCVWGFSSEGLVIKKVTEKDAYPNYKHEYAGTPVSPFSISKSKHLTLPDPKITDFKYFSSNYYNNEITYVDKEDRSYEDNRQTNIKYRNKPLNTLIVPYSEFPPYEIGDIALLDFRYIVLARQLVLGETLNMTITYGTYWNNTRNS